MIRKVLKEVFLSVLRFKAKLILKKYKPKVIGITGSVGKTSTKDASALILSVDYFTRKSSKSYSGQIEILFTIVGVKNRHNFLSCLEVLFRCLKILVVRHDYPEVLILEMGVDRPGDMVNLLSLVKLDAGVIAGLGEIPSHVEFFKSPDELAREKFRLVESLKKEGYAILNGDDSKILERVGKVKSNIITYGFDEGNDIIASNYNIIYKTKDGFDSKVPDGISFKIDHKGSIIPIRLHNIFGRQAVYSILAAIALGVSQNLNLVEISKSLESYIPPPGRLNLIEGIKKTFILDDSYNSSPVAVKFALDTLKEVEMKGRKIAVLGDMLELGKYTVDAHKQIGAQAKEVADYLFVVGPRSKFIVEGAREENFEESKIKEFSNSKEVGAYLHNFIKEGDLILIKGSQDMRMERAVEEIMAKPEDKEDLLVRQESKWLT